MKVNFEKVIIPCVVNDITLWHLEHGFLWDVVEVPSGRRIAVFFCTLLCGDGLIVHFDSVENIEISPASVFSAMRKGVRMIREYGNVVYATIPAEKSTLIHCACRLGFDVVEAGGFLRDGKEIVLLKYFKGKSAILDNRNTQNLLTRKDVL